MNAPGGQAPQRPVQQNFGITPEQVLNLPFLDPERKQKLSALVRDLHQQIATHPAGHQEHITAKQKLTEFTVNCRTQLQKWKQQQNAQQNAAAQNNMQQANAQQGNQPQPGQQPQQIGQHPQQPQAMQPGQQPQPGQQQPGAKPGMPPQLSSKAMAIASQAQIQLPANLTMGTPDAEKYIREERYRYAQALNSLELQQTYMAKLQPLIDNQKNNGTQLPPQIVTQIQQTEKRLQQSRQFIENFKEKHKLSAATQGAANGATTGAGQQTPVSATAPQRPGAGQAVNTNATPTASSPQNAQAPGQLPGSRPGTAQQSQVPNQTPMAQAGGSGAARPQAPNAQQPGTSQNPVLNPQVPPSAGAQSAPQPFSHQAAIDAANRSYSSDQAQRPAQPQQHPSQMATTPREPSTPTPGIVPGTSGQNHFPIPEQLNLAQPNPQAVSMGANRPTISGPGGATQGMIGQPAIQQQQRFNLEGEGEHVLSKKKLDELVRQVTGGSESSADALTPEVEEAILQMADNFIDDVVSAACKVAKLRPSATLEARDLQLILERNYNIRIPGYSMDETRTVKKFQPAAGWTQKMNAIQAAKVMGSTKMDL